MYRSEGPAQVFLLVLVWMIAALGRFTREVHQGGAKEGGGISQQYVSLGQSSGCKKATTSAGRSKVLVAGRKENY